jgi:hypothetical protein
LVVGGDASSLVGAVSPSVDAASVVKAEAAVNAESAET